MKIKPLEILAGIKISDSIIIKEIIVRSGADSEHTQNVIYNYLHKVSLGHVKPRKYHPSWWKKIMNRIRRIFNR